MMRVSGEVDLTTAPTLYDELAKCARDIGRLPTIDLSGVSYFDSSGVQALVKAKSDKPEAADKPSIVGVRPHVLNVMRLVGLDRLFDITGSDEPGPPR